MKKITLIDELQEPTSVSPKSILLYGKPKTGKSTVLSLLENSFIIDTENGSNFIKARKYQINKRQSVENQAEEFVNVLRAIYEKGYNKKTGEYIPSYKYLIIDTFTRLNEWSEIIGTLNYMNKTNGKKFNVKTDEDGNIVRDEDGKIIRLKSTDKEFETVHSLAHGYGYPHSREVMMDWFNKINMLADVVIYVCHTKDKFIGSELNEIPETTEINLTGALKHIISSNVDTIAYGYRKDNKFYMSFSDNNGTRASYLSGKNIKLTETDENGEIIENNWHLIFKDV